VADYTDSKARVGAVYPVQAVDQQIWKRLEPLMTAEQLKMRHLFGIPLVSQIRDPLTNKAAVMTDDILKDYIVRAVNDAEIELGISIFPVQYDERMPFEAADFRMQGFLKTENKPISSVDRMAIITADQTNIYQVDPAWISPDHFSKGHIFLLPLSLSLAGNGSVQGSPAQGTVFMSLMAHRSYVASFWSVKLTAGFPEGQIPVIVNELIGVISAMKVLSMLATTYARVQSSSLSIDGTSQSSSGLGPAIFKVRLDELQTQRTLLVGKLRGKFSAKIFSAAF